MITSQTDKTGPTEITGLPQTIPVGFPFQSASDLLVLDNGPTSGPYDPAVVLTLNSDYTVTGGGYNAANAMQTGSITVNASGANNVLVNDNVIIMRGVPINQPTSLIETGPLTVALIEQALDRLATIEQQINEVTTRSLRFENYEFLDGTLNFSQRLGNLLAFNSVTGAVEFITPSGQIVPQGNQWINAADFSVTSSTTLANAITGTITQTGLYTFQVNAYLGAGAGGVKFGMGGTVVASAVMWTANGIVSGTEANTIQYSSNLTTSIGIAASSGTVLVTLNGSIVVTTPGTLAFQFAQNSSNAAASKVYAGSSLIIQ